MAKNLENAEKITYDELRAWMTGLIRGKRGAIPDLEDWKQIKIMMDKVEPEVVTIPPLNHSDVYGPIVTQPNDLYDPYSPWCDSPTVVRNPFGGFTNESLRTTTDAIGTIDPSLTTVGDAVPGLATMNTGVVTDTAMVDGYGSNNAQGHVSEPTHLNDIHNHGSLFMSAAIVTKNRPYTTCDQDIKIKEK